MNFGLDFQYICNNYIGQIPYMALDVAALHCIFIGMQEPQMTFVWKQINICFFCSVSCDTGTVQLHPELIKLIVNYKPFLFVCFFPKIFFDFLVSVQSRQDWTANSWVRAAF